MMADTLVSGSNENSVFIWNVYELNNHEWEPQMRLTAHSAVVEAVALCPWQSNLLPSSKGTVVGHLRFWKLGNITCLDSEETRSQVGFIFCLSQRKNSSLLMDYLKISLWSGLLGCFVASIHTSHIRALVKYEIFGEVMKNLTTWNTKGNAYKINVI